MADYCVAYVTKTGTSKEMAERITNRLNEMNVDTEVRNLAEMDNPEDYKGIIVGGPINGMRMSTAFKENSSRLKSRLPRVLGVYAASMLYFHGRKMWVNAINKQLSATAEELGTTRFGVFGGRSPGPLPGIARWIFGTPSDMPADTVDWTKLSDWTDEIARDLAG